MLIKCSPRVIYYNDLLDEYVAGDILTLDGQWVTGPDGLVMVRDPKSGCVFRVKPWDIHELGSVDSLNKINNQLKREAKECRKIKKISTNR